MDTKWKNNNQKSIGIVIAIVFVLTVLFVLFLPFIRERADEEYEDPFTESAFIRTIYEANFFQYKYLRERADQRTYSLGDLFVDAEYLGTNDEDSHHDGITVYVAEESVADSDSLTGEVEAYKESLVSEQWESKSLMQQLTQMMDYYAVDEKTGVSVGNSNQSALQEIAEGKSPQNNPYVYYVYLNYDGIGNIENCAVSASGKVGDFLKRVEALGREQYLTDYFDESNVCYINFYNEQWQEFYRYKFTAKGPSNIKIVYAMTQEQYQTFLDGSAQFYFLPNYALASEKSYYESGATDTVLLFALIAMVLGAGAVYFFNRKEKGSYTYQDMRLCQLPLELNVILFFLGMALAEPLVTQICAYQRGWFLGNINRQLLEPYHLEGLRLVVLSAMFFLYFFAAYTLGSVLPQMLHFKSYFKKHSLCYRYWDRIITGLKRFYQELVSFDIGTDARRIITKLVIVNFLILAFMSLFWVWGVFFMAMYSVVIYFLLKKYVKDVQNKYQNLLRATSAIAKGDLDIVLSEDFGVFESYKNELRQIQVDFKKAVDEEVKSQRMKSELITNVSHDLKTPLTAIITYINLLKVPGITEEQQKEYIETLDKKAVRLKVLIEDLFEVSKATTNNITLNYDKVDIGNLLRQCYLEYEDRIEEADLQFKFMLPEEKVTLMLDSQKTFRIFENLYTNIVKYALPSTRVYVSMKNNPEDVEIEIKNISRTELNVAPDELTERFVRGDGSRNTEGSGLGLAIARSFTELQHGTLSIFLDGDLFKVTLRFRKWNGSAESKSAAEGGAGDREKGGSEWANRVNGRQEAEDHGAGKEPASAAGANQRPKPFYDPRRWRSEKNLRKKKWK